MKIRNRCTALLLSLVMALTLALPAAAAEPVTGTPALGAPGGDMEGSIVILHTNDVHGGIAGYASVAALRDYYVEKGACVLLLDAGDFIQGDPTVSESQGETAVGLMNAVGYDAAAMGNHEFDYGTDNLLERMEQATFPILAANVLKDGEELSAPYVKFDCGKLTVGVFGLETPETATKAHPGKVQGVSFLGGQALYDCAQARVNEMKADGCNVIVCLGHLGIDGESQGSRSIDLLENVKGIHVFLDGHSHSTLADMQAATNQSCAVNGALLVSAGTKLENIGVVVIGPNGSTTASNVPVASMADTLGVTPDEAIAAQAAAIQAEIDREYSTVFARTEVPLDGERETNRTQETNLGDLICDAMLWQAGELGLDADAAVFNGGGIRASIEAGDMTRKDINTVLPFGNTLYVVQVTGQELLNALEASCYAAPEALGGFPQVAGIEMVLNTGAPYAAGEQYPNSTYYGPAQVNRVTVDTVGGADFAPDELYTVVTNDFLGAGGDTYYAFKSSPIGYDMGVPVDEVVMDYISAKLGGTVTAEQYGAAGDRIRTLSYDDVLAGDWFNDAVTYVTFAELMNGTGHGFRPSMEVNRATLVTVLYRMAGSPAVSGEMDFGDVESGQWYTDAVCWAAESGITTGMKPGVFAPMNILTREQLATFFYRFTQMQGGDVSLSGENLLDGYLDAAAMHEYAREPLGWAVERGLISGVITSVSGVHTTLLAPDWAATRAQFATILMRYEQAG